METLDTIRLVCEVLYPSTTREVRALSRVHWRAVPDINQLYDDRAEVDDDESTYVLDLWDGEVTWVRHGIAPVWINHCRHYQRFHHGYRDWALSRTRYYFGFYGDLEPLYGINLVTGNVMIYHGCYCSVERCLFRENNKYNYSMVSLAVTFSDMNPV